MLNNDKRYQDLSDSEWHYAKNILLTKKHGRKSNEYGFEKITTPFTGKVIGIIELPDRFLFIEILPNGKNAFWLYFNYQFDLKFIADIGFTEEHPIKGVYSFIQNQIIVVLTDNNITPKYINLDCLPFKIDINGELLNPLNIKLLELFSEYSNPIYKLNVNDFGGSYKSGSYFITGYYEHKDGSQTNYVHVSNGISIHDDNSVLDFNKIDGCEANTQTSKSIEITFKNLDTDYLKFHIIIIEKIAGNEQAYKVLDFNITSEEHTISLYGNELKTKVNKNDILINSEIFKTIGAITTLFNRLYVADIVVDDYNIPLDIGKDINVTWIRDKQIPVNSYKNSYKDPKSIFEFKSFKSNEVYAFYYSYILNNGKETRAFHIPAPELTSSDNTDININNFPNYNVLGDNLKRYQIEPTQKQYGQLHTFENKNETYPECYGSLAGKKVRHFRFPNLTQLGNIINPNNSNKFISENTDDFNETIADNDTVYNEFTVNNMVLSVGASADDNLIIGSPNFVTNLDNSIGEFLTFGSVPSPYKNTTPHYSKIYKANQSQKIQFTITVQHLTNKSINVPLSINIIDSAFNLITSIEDIILSSSYDNPTSRTFTVSLNSGEYLSIHRHLFTSAQLQDFRLTLTGKSYDIDSTINSSNIIVAQPLGIKISNIPIPDVLKGKVKSIKFYYAKRTINNSLINGQSMLIPISNDWNNSVLNKKLKIHPFDNLLDKYSNHPNFIQPILSFKTSNHLDLKFDIKSKTDYSENYKPLNNIHEFTRKILNYNYIEHGLPTPNFLNFNNEFGESSILIDLIKNITPTDNTEYYLSDLVFLRDNCYLELENQELIDTGYVQPVKEETQTLINTDSIYGGDTFISLVGLRLTRPNKEDFPVVNNTNNYRILAYFTETINNVNLRHEGIDPKESYYPKTEILPDGNDYTNYLGYNKDYTSLNNFVKTIPEYCTDGCNEKIIKFTNRIYRSGVLSTEGVSFWRRFNPLDYYDIVNDKGGITNLESFNKTLLIHTKYSLFIASIKDQLETDNLKVYLGTGDVFDREPDEIITSKSGFGGLQHRFTAKVTDIGYVFLDEQQRKWFVYNGKLEELKEGIGNWLFNNTSMPTFRDNPYIGQGYSIGYDSENGRLLLSKLHTPETSYTLSYIYGYGFICFHSYIPNYYIQNRLGTYALKINSNKTELYKFNNKSNRCKFFNDTPDETVIDLIARTEEFSKTTISAILIDCETELDGNKFNEILSHIMLYNNNQCSGLLELIATTNSILKKTNIRRYRNYWIFNRFKDVMRDYNSAILDNNFNLIPTALENNKSWFKKSNFISPFVIVRLLHDNQNQFDIYINGVNSFNENTII